MHPPRLSAACPGRQLEARRDLSRQLGGGWPPVPGTVERERGCYEADATRDLAIAFLINKV